ncbi:DUF6931 family protein [Erwinia sp. BNK-24-b]|uniref:DUF6931 family protein n=1 Tax=unclassified Erwinia TaxID=2622719 RepID=UPI0039BFF824
MTMISPGGLALLEHAAGFKGNIAVLLSARRWEDALAYWVENVPVQELLEKVLPIIVDSADSEEQICVNAIRGWLKERNDAARRHIFEQAESLGFATPLGAIGLALFWMDGSLTPPECEPVYAEKHLAPLMLCTAVKLLSVSLAADNPPVAGAKLLFSRGYNMEVA